MDIKKTITICGMEVKLKYCAAAENGFEELSGKSISDIDFTRQKDMLNLAVACIVAAYTEANEELPISSSELLYNITPKELTDLFLTILNLRAGWYEVPKNVVKKLEDEARQMTAEEKELAEKNVHAPTTATVGS